MLIPSSQKNWDVHVPHAELVARSAGFVDLRDRIVALADPRPGEVVVDIGAGTGLLALECARRGSKVWAVDIASSMCEHLRAKARSAGLDSIDVAVGSAVCLPFVDRSADVVVSNYCFHHLSDADKLVAVAEVRRILRPGGRFVFGDMMFALDPRDPRDRQVVITKVRAIVRKGMPGVMRILRNAVRIAARRWEHPAKAAWWERALADSGFEGVSVRLLEHEGGVASARRPID